MRSPFIWRAERLFFLNGEQDLSAFLLVDLGIVKYPTYKCIVSQQIFSARDDLLGYEEVSFYLCAKENEGGLQILKRWDVPWEWQTVSLISLACGLSFVLTGLVEAAVVPYLGLSIQDLSLDEKAEFLLVAQGVTTVAILGVLYTVAGKFQPLPQDIYRYDWREPFSLQRGWLFWAGIGLVGTVAAVALTGAATSFFSGQTPEREELFVKLNRMTSIAADMFVGRERFTTLLFMRLTETVILWLSEDQSFWDDIEDGPRPLGPLGLQQFYLDMKFVICFASQGHFLSRNLQRVINEIISKAMTAFSATGMDPYSGR